MGFLRKLIQSLKSNGGFVSTIESEPAIAPVIEPMKRGDIRPALALFHQSQDHEVRFRLVEAAASLFGTEVHRTSLLDAWVNNTPDDTYARLVRAYWRIESAPNWKPNDPEEVADAARAANTEAAHFAAAEYGAVASASPNDPVPWGLQLGLPLIYKLDAKRQLYAEVMRRSPMFDAHLALHNALSAMWYGDHEQSLGFARSVSASAPVGSDVHALVCYARYRIYGYERFYGDNKENAKALLADPAAQAEVRAALDRSIFSSQYRPGHWHLFCHHAAAAWFQASDDRAGCRAALERVGYAFDEKASPWHVSLDRYCQIRKWAGL